MKNQTRIILIFTTAMLLSACSKTTFTNINPSMNKVLDVPMDIIEPDPVQFGFKMSSGACNQDSSTNVLSCMKCDVPVNPKVRQLSVKAQALVDSMYLACQISNKSDHNNFRPTKEMLIEKLNRGSDELYPDTPRTAQMELVVNGLTNELDNSLQKKMFGFLWYTASYSDAFETYFGLTVQEAKSTFCWNGDKQTPALTDASLTLISKSMIDCLYGNGGHNGTCKELPEYELAKGYRKQLENVLSKSISSPYVAPGALPQKTCAWEKFEGDDLVEAKKQVSKWKQEGRTVAMEVLQGDGAGFCGMADATTLKPGMNVKVATYICK